MEGFHNWSDEDLNDAAEFLRTCNEGAFDSLGRGRYLLTFELNKLLAKQRLGTLTLPTVREDAGGMDGLPAK